MADGDVTFTYSAVVPKEGKPYIAVMFERKGGCAEGSVPACRITKSSGFSEGEVAQLENYLRENKSDIIERAKGISGIRHWFGG